MAKSCDRKRINIFCIPQSADNNRRGNKKIIHTKKGEALSLSWGLGWQLERVSESA